MQQIFQPSHLQKTSVCSAKNRVLFFRFLAVFLFSSCLFTFPYLLGCTRCGTATEDGTKTTHTDSDKTRTAVVLGSNSEPDTLNPLMSELSSTQEVIFFCLRELTFYDDKWQLQPDLASEIPTFENGRVRYVDRLDAKAAQVGEFAQSLEVTWSIKPSARWSDGKPVIADDFVFVWELMRMENSPIVNRQSVDKIANMESRDDGRTLVVTWREPYAFYADYRIHRALPSHLLRARWLDQGLGVDIRQDSFNTHPLCNGPFQIDEWRAGQYIRLSKNKYAESQKNDDKKKNKKVEQETDLPQGQPIDEILIRFLSGTQAIQASLLAEEIDGFLPTSGLTVNETAQFLQQEAQQQKQRYMSASVSGLVWAHIDFNLDSPLLRDVRVRRALAHAIDRAGMLKQLFQGDYLVADGFLPPRHWGYDDKLPKIDFDLQKSAALLEEAGWKLSSDGTARINQQGEKLAFILNGISGVKDVEDVEQVIQSSLRSIGVQVDIDNRPSKLFFSELMRPRRFPHMAFYSWVMDPANDGASMWRSDMIPSSKNNQVGRNFAGWYNAEVDQILQRTSLEMNPEKRRTMLQRVQQLYIDELPAIPMYFRPVASIVRRELQGFRPTGTQTPVAWNAQQWRWREQTADKHQ